jgi:uncharacterized hydrophobic protein (TIGR00271 family)
MSGLTQTLIPQAQRQTVAELNDALDLGFGETSSKRTGFLIMLTLSGIIAIAGVLTDSTATVIGAMIIAPLGTPILGIALGIVTGHLSLVLRSIFWVLSGLVIVVVLGLLFSAFVATPESLATNSQVVGRTSPSLMDLIAALATGFAGGFAMCRKDLSAVLPGVAIAISLVPPLTVVGLCAESGAYSESAGALLLFGTNVAAILATGLVVMAIYRVHRLVTPASTPERRAVNRRNAVLVVAAFVVVIGVPLTSSTLRIAGNTADESRIRAAADTWAAQVGWKVASIDTTSTDDDIVRFIGPSPVPSTASLRTALEEEGADPDNVVAEFVFEESIALRDGG